MKTFFIIPITLYHSLSFLSSSMAIHKRTAIQEMNPTKNPVKKSILSLTFISSFIKLNLVVYYM